MCKITAPEDEPQRGTVIQTDPSGKIETVKDDQGLNRIVSREEFMNRPENQPMQRPDNQSGMLQQYSDKDAVQETFVQQRGFKKNKNGDTGDVRELRKLGVLDEPITGPKEVSGRGDSTNVGSAFYDED